MAAIREITFCGATLPAASAPVGPLWAAAREGPPARIAKPQRLQVRQSVCRAEKTAPHPSPQSGLAEASCEAETEARIAAPAWSVVQHEGFREVRRGLPAPVFAASSVT
jgi:hypothetical protein